MKLVDEIARAIDGECSEYDPSCDGKDCDCKLLKRKARAALSVIVRSLWDYSLEPGHQVSVARVWLEAWLKENEIEPPAHIEVEGK